MSYTNSEKTRPDDPGGETWGDLTQEQRNEVLARHVVMRRLDSDHYFLMFAWPHCDCVETVRKLYADKR